MTQPLYRQPIREVGELVRPNTDHIAEEQGRVYVDFDVRRQNAIAEEARVADEAMRPTRDERGLQTTGGRDIAKAIERPKKGILRRATEHVIELAGGEDIVDRTHEALNAVNSGLAKSHVGNHSKLGHGPTYTYLDMQKDMRAAEESFNPATGLAHVVKKRDEIQRKMPR